MVFPKNYSFRFFSLDCSIGIIIALVSIPISMGYAQVAGLPAVYGLYGSLLPVIAFALLSSSPRFVFGVDAAPAALTGGILAAMGTAPESDAALSIIPVISLCVAAWLLIFFFIRADRILKFISQPVMAGFITGIGMTIILMQIPKLFNGTTTHGELMDLSVHIFTQACLHFNLPSFILGISTIIIILLCRRFFPKIPVQPLLMFLGAAAFYYFPLDSLGIKTLPAVKSGLPALSFPSLSLLFSNYEEILFPAFSIAVVILSETLLATSSTALKHEDTLKTRREILAYTAGNFLAALSSSCPVNGSVSRTAIAGQFGVKSQVMSVSAGLTMGLILMFGTGFIEWLPLPVLTAIVISALTGTLEFSFAARLRKSDKTEFLIFCSAFLAVLFFGTVWGVITGVLLSTFAFIIRQSKPSTDFLGVVSGTTGFYSLTRRGSAAVPIKGAVIYKFSGPLFYANINQFYDDITSSILKNTKTVIVDSSGITSIDTTAAQRIIMLRQKLERSKISFKMAGHVSRVNDQLRTYGARELIEQKCVRKRISGALADSGFTEPYPLQEKPSLAGGSNISAEFDWAFGTESERVKLEIAARIAEEIIHNEKVNGDRLHEMARDYASGYWNDADEDELLDMIQAKILLLDEEHGIRNKKQINSAITDLHVKLEISLLNGNRASIKRIIRKRRKRELLIRQKFPALYEKIQVQQEAYFNKIAMENPELAKMLAGIISENEF